MICVVTQGRTGGYRIRPYGEPRIERHRKITRGVEDAAPYEQILLSS